jgi:magnesium transporter
MDVPDFVKNEFVDSGDCKTAQDELIEIVKAVLKSYDEPAVKLTRSIEYYEEHIFLKDRKVPILEGLYFLKPH